MNSIEDYNMKKVWDFRNAVMHAMDKIKQRDYAAKTVALHLGSIEKKIGASNLAILREKIKNIIHYEKNVAYSQESEARILKELRQKVHDLQNQLVLLSHEKNKAIRLSSNELKNVKQLLEDIKRHVHQYVKFKSEEEEKFERINKKLDQKYNKAKQLGELKERIKMLEMQKEKFKKHGKYDKKEMSLIEGKIRKLKTALH